MRVAIINFTWGDGSTGKITVNLYNRAINAGNEARVFFGVKPNNREQKQDFVYFGDRFCFLIDHIISNITGLSGALAYLPTIKLLWMLNKFKPDVIWLYNIHGGFVNEYWLLNYAKKHAKWTLYSMPDEYAFLGKCCYSYDCEKFKHPEGCHHCPQLKDSPKSLFFDNSHFHFKKKEKAYKGFDNITFISAPYVVDKAKSSWLLKDKEFFARDSKVDVQHIYYPRDTSSVRRELGIAKDKKVVMVCASINSAYKGVKYFLEAARKCENEDIVFVNVGYGGDETVLPTNYIPLPYVHDQNKLAELLSLADAYVCTSIADAQPNACINALGCGTPIIGFNISGVPYMASEEFGTFVTPFDVDELADVIRKVPRKTKERIDACHEYALNRYDFQRGINNEEIINIIAKRIEEKQG